MADAKATEPARFRDLLREIRLFAGPRLPWAIFIVVLGAVLEGAGLVLLLPVAETIFAQSGEARSGITGALLAWMETLGIVTVIGQLALMGGAFILLVMARAAVLLKRDVLIMQLSHGFIDHIRAQFFNRLASADWPVIKRFRKAHLLNTMTTNIGRLAQTMNFLSHGVVMAALGFAYLVAAFVVSKVLGLALLGLIAAGLIGAVIWMKRSHLLGQRLNRANRGVMHETTRFLDGMKAGKAARAEKELTERFSESIAETRAVSVQFVSQQAKLRNMVQLVASLGALLVLLVGYGIVGLTGGELLVMAAIVTRMAPNLMATFSGLQSISFAMPAYESIRRLEHEISTAHSLNRTESEKDAVVDFDMSAPLLVKNARVDVNNDEGERLTLVRAAELQLEPGMLVHVSGPSGAGKSTLVELLAGLHLPAAGSVTRGAIALTAENRRAWQGQIAFAPQEPFIFDGTLRENLLWPNLEVDEAEIWEQLEAAEAGDIVRGLPQGLDEELLDGGARLSGGERQRLCLARALLRPASLIILDEATSAMDPELERRVIGRLRENIGGRIVLLVSHSLNAAGYADMRITVANGSAEPA